MELSEIKRNNYKSYEDYIAELAKLLKENKVTNANAIAQNEEDKVSAEDIEAAKRKITLDEKQDVLNKAKENLEKCTDDRKKTRLLRKVAVAERGLEATVYRNGRAEVNAYLKASEKYIKLLASGDEMRRKFDLPNHPWIAKIVGPAAEVLSSPKMWVDRRRSEFRRWAADIGFPGWQDRYEAKVDKAEQAVEDAEARIAKLKEICKDNNFVMNKTYRRFPFARTLLDVNAIVKEQNRVDDLKNVYYGVGVQKQSDNKADLQQDRESIGFKLDILNDKLKAGEFTVTGRSWEDIRADIVRSKTCDAKTLDQFPIEFMKVALKNGADVKSVADAIWNFASGQDFNKLANEDKDELYSLLAKNNNLMKEVLDVKIDAYNNKLVEFRDKLEEKVKRVKSKEARQAAKVGHEDEIKAKKEVRKARKKEQETEINMAEGMNSLESTFIEQTEIGERERKEAVEEAVAKGMADILGGPLEVDKDAQQRANRFNKKGTKRTAEENKKAQKSNQKGMEL